MCCEMEDVRWQRVERDSLASFNAIYDLLLKSALLIALHASALFAPILVPDLNSWLAKAATDWRCTGTRDG